MSFKAKEPTGTVVHNPACAWCSGSGMIRVPDYDYIGAYGHYDAIMNDSIDPFAWQVCTRSVYCHVCYPEPPERKKDVRYNNLLSHILRVRREGIPDSIDVLIAVLNRGLALHGKKHLAGEMIAEVIR